MLTLYHNDMSVCSAKVRVALAEKKQEWTGVHLDLRAGDAQKPDYLKLNPNAVVPTLVIDGKPLIESTIICEYVDDAFSDPPLRPADNVARGLMRVWTKQLDDTLHVGIANLSFCIAFRHQWLARPAEDRTRWLDGIPQVERRNRQKANLELGLTSPHFRPALQRWLKLFADADAVLANGRWLAGDSFSLAEVGYAPYLARLRHLGCDALFDRYPRVADWAERVAARPSVAAGVAGWFNPKYLALFAEKRDEARAMMAKMVA